MNTPRLVVLGALLAGCTNHASSEESSASGQAISTTDEDCEKAWGEEPASFDGVEGTYARVGQTPAFRMKTMTLSNHLASPTGHISSEARYARTFECSSCSEETGVAQMVPINPAVSPMLSFSTNGFGPGANVRDVYTVIAIQRIATNISAMCLYAQNEERTFVMRR